LKRTAATPTRGKGGCSRLLVEEVEVDDEDDEEASIETSRGDLH